MISSSSLPKRPLLFLITHDLRESYRARWFHFYIATVVFFIALFAYFGIAESRSLGFTGLGRSLLVMIQISILILPLFILISTARTMIADRENGIWEYYLSLPIPLSRFFFSKVISRVLMFTIPLILAISLLCLSSLFKHVPIPWNLVIYYNLFLTSQIILFTGLAFLISVLSPSQESALAFSFFIWIILEALIDALLLGLLLQQRISSEALIFVALVNPLQLFRMASISLFDPDISVLGPIAHSILNMIDVKTLALLNIFYPALLGLVILALSYMLFKRKDLV